MPLHAVRDGNLALHQDIPVFCRRLHDRKADLQRRKTPAAAGQHWFAVHQRVKVVGGEVLSWGRALIGTARRRTR